MAGAALGSATWPEIDASRPSTLVLPIGSTEQHGPHLPLDTDTRLAVDLADAAADGLDDVVVAPALPFGAAGEHAGFPGTLSIGTSALVTVLVELVRSAMPPFRRTVIVNGHGGNLEALADAVAVARSEGRDVEVWSPSVPGGDAHAGRTETSLLLARCPELVRSERAEPGATAPLAELLPRLRSEGVAGVAPNGVLGDPTGASAEEGAEVFARLVAEVRAVLVGVAR